MFTYVTLYKWTDQGARNVKGAPDRMSAAVKAVEQMGGKVLALYVTMGEFDLVAITQWPSDEAGVAMLLSQAAQGNVQTRTMRGFTPEEFAAVLKRLP